MAEKTPAQVVLSFLEYRAVFREPLFEIWGQHGSLVHAVYNSFREWNISLENVTAKENQPANASEIQVNFSLLNGKVIFGVGIGSVSLVATNPSWEDVELIKRIGSTGLQSVVGATKGVIDKQLVILSMHLKPMGKQVYEVSSRFVHAEVPKAMGGAVKGLGFSVYADECAWVVDLSAPYPGALFVRLNRIFDGSVPLNDIAAQTEKDENRLLEMLQLSLD
ncbi:MAG: hypothetical protein L0212_08150 [Acidobacteria bacterium]|nr:hypothetical protein [Acidobacteriota bacterium]